MAGKLNFAIALNMTTKQFRKGTDFVKRSLKSMQYQVMGMVSAFGLGAVGLSNFASRFIDVARETNRARIALKNISGDATGFANNMNFLIKASNKWGQELNGMTSEFAKFSAAATSAGIPIKEQQTIFESFTRSITAFGLSSSDAHLSYLALSQMMSKGKISSEELRRQLGERMPVAMEAMARAVGVTIQELDGLLKAGKLLSKDVMMPFVQEMEKMLPTVDVDNIETSVNRLKNTFIKLTEDLKIGEFYKKVVDGATKMLSNIQSSFVRVIAVIANTYITGKLVSAFKSLTKTAEVENAKLLANKKLTEEQATLATAKRIAAEKNYNRVSTLHSNASDDAKLAHYTKYKSAERALDRARLKEKSALLAKDVAANAIASTKTQTVWTVAWTKIGSFAKGAILSIKAALSSILPMAVIGLLTNFVFKLIEARKEAQRIRDIGKSNIDSIFNVADTSEMQRIRTLHKIVENRLGTEKEINAAHGELLRMLGVEQGRQVDLNKEVSKRISLLREAARADVAAQNNAQLEKRNRELMQEMTSNGDMISVRQYLDEYKKLDADLKEYNAPRGERVKQEARLAEKWGVKPSEWGGNKRPTEIFENLRAIEYNNKIIENSVRAGIDLSGGGGGGGGGGKGDETPLEKAEQKYIDELEKLTNQKESGVISTKDYNKAVDELNQAIYEEIGGILGAGANLNETFQKAMAGVENPLSAGRLTEVTDDYSKTLKELDEKKRLGLLSEEGYNDALLDLISATIDKVSSFDKITKAEEKYIKNLSDIQKDVAVAPTKESRDTTFDYKKTESDILSEQRALQDRYVQDLKSNMDKLKEYGVEAMEEIRKEEEKLTTLSDALKLAQLKEDIKDLNFDIFDESVSGITGFANGLDRVSKSWARLASEDMSGFERVVATINALGDTIGAIIRTWESYLAIKEMIALKEGAMAAQEQALTGQRIANDTAEATSAITKSAVVTAALGAEKVAATGVMAAKSTAAYASIPFAGSTLAAAQIATMQGLISSATALAALPGFKDGGIVGGLSKSGDKQLIRVNAGEMIMNTNQQSKLWGAIQKGDFGGGGGGNVKFEIEGQKLVGIFKQHNQKMSRR